MRRRNPEDEICMALMNWWAYQCKLRGCCVNDLTFSMGGNNLSKAARGKSKAMGYHAGTPDYFLSVGVGGYNGMYLEIKTEVGQLTKEQKEVIARRRNRGYACAVAYGLDEARDLITEYLMHEQGHRFRYDTKSERKAYLKKISTGG